MESEIAELRGYLGRLSFSILRHLTELPGLLA
jgi:hypothetical protein